MNFRQAFVAWALVNYLFICFPKTFIWTWLENKFWDSPEQHNSENSCSDQDHWEVLLCQLIDDFGSSSSWKSSSGNSSSLTVTCLKVPNEAETMCQLSLSLNYRLVITTRRSLQVYSDHRHHLKETFCGLKLIHKQRNKIISEWRRTKVELFKLLRSLRLMTKQHENVPLL